MTYFRMVFLMGLVAAVIIINVFVLDVNTMEYIMMLEILGSKENVKSYFEFIRIFFSDINGFELFLDTILASFRLSRILLPAKTARYG